MTIVGKISNQVETALNLNKINNRNIYIGKTNIEHMKNSHPRDFAKYRNEISKILSDPDYVGLNKKDNSIEYVKEYKIDNEYVKVAVRVSRGNRFYARSLYVLNKRRVENFISKGTLIPLDKYNKIEYNINEVQE